MKKEKTKKEEKQVEKQVEKSSRKIDNRIYVYCQEDVFAWVNENASKMKMSTSNYTNLVLLYTMQNNKSFLPKLKVTP